MRSPLPVPRPTSSARMALPRQRGCHDHEHGVPGVVVGGGGGRCPEAAPFMGVEYTIPMVPPAAPPLDLGFAATAHLHAALAARPALNSLVAALNTGAYVLWAILAEARPRATIAALMMFTCRGVLGCWTQLPLPEVDRVYLSAPPKIVTIDHEKKRNFIIRKGELPDVVVWNPWDKKAKAMPDFGCEEYKCMLCVGAACIEKPITLRPGEEWQGRQEISSVPSSHSSGQLDPEIIRQMQHI